MQEIFKDIKGYEGMYQISNFGRVRSLDREIHHTQGGVSKIKGRIKIPGVDKKGYFRLPLSKENKQVTFKIHRLVTQYFIPNPDNKPQVNHKDLNKQNNRSDNLEWLTNQENMDHFRKSDLAEERDKKIRCENNPRAKLTWDDVNLIRKLKEEYSFPNRRLSWLFGVGIDQIRKIIYYKQWVKPEIKEAI